MNRCIEPLEPRQLLASVADQQHPFTFHDTDGSAVTVRLTGPGSAFVETGDAFAMSLARTTAGTTLSIDVAGGDGRTTLNGLSARSVVGSIRAKAVDFGGPISIKSVETFETRSLTGADLSTGWVGALSAKRISHSFLAADRIGAISVNGDFTDTRTHVSPADDSKAAIANVTVKGTIADSTIFTLGDITSVWAGAMLRSNLIAGVTMYRASPTSDSIVFNFPTRPAAKEHELHSFSGTYRIDHVTVGVAANSPMIAFSDTLIAAYEVGTARLQNVNGTFRGVASFGIGAYEIGSVRRNFDAANTAKDAQEFAISDFRVSQIKEPLRFDPSTGTFGDNDMISHGGSAVAAGDMRVVYTVYPGLGGFMSTEPQYDAFEVGTLENHSASKVFLVSGGKFELRNNKRKVIARANTLIDAIEGVFSGYDTSIKVSRVGNSGTNRFLVTSDGPVLKIGEGVLNHPVYERERVLPPGTREFFQSTLMVLGASTHVLPTFNQISAELKRRRHAVLVYTDGFSNMFDEPLVVGSVATIGFTGTAQVEPSLELKAAGRSFSNLSELVTNFGSDRIGKRRLPMRVIRFGNTVRLIGVPNGGSIDVENFDRLLINRSGDVFKVETQRQFKQKLNAAGIVI